MHTFSLDALIQAATDKQESELGRDVSDFEYESIEAYFELNANIPFMLQPYI